VVDGYSARKRLEVLMDWFERLTGLDPDASDGSFERLLVTAVALAIVVIGSAISLRLRSRRPL
jgi:hypothetical protein